jgi:hypothetical protein
MKPFLAVIIVSLILLSHADSQTKAKIDAGEYFVDVDPGMGNATPLPFGISDTAVNINFALPAMSGYMTVPGDGDLRRGEPYTSETAPV